MRNLLEGQTYATPSAHTRKFFFALRTQGTARTGVPVPPGTEKSQPSDQARSTAEIRYLAPSRTTKLLDKKVSCDGTGHQLLKKDGQLN